MIGKFVNKLKSLLHIKSRDTLTDRPDFVPEDINDIDATSDQVDAAAIKLLFKQLVGTANRINYDAKHLGMSNYRKWHKNNRKWRH